MKYKVYDITNQKEVKLIYEAYKGKIFEPNISPNGELCFRCMGIDGLQDGFNHESYINKKLGIEYKVCWGIKVGNMEFYEGDIVKVVIIDKFGDKSTYLGKIEFDKDDFSWLIRETDDSYWYLNEYPESEGVRYLELLGNVCIDKNLLN